MISVEKNERGLNNISQLKYCALSNSLLPLTLINPYSLSQPVVEFSSFILQNQPLSFHLMCYAVLFR